jgi:hypothetical protein
MFDDAQACILETECTAENSLTLVDEDRFGYVAQSATVRAKTCSTSCLFLTFSRMS